MCTSPHEFAAATVERRSIPYDDRERDFILVSPPRLQPGSALVMVLHGTLQTGSEVRQFSGASFDAFTHSGRVLVAYPNAVHREWNGARKATMLSRGVKTIDDVGFVRHLVEQLAESHHIDRETVFIVGFSLGGQMVIRLLHDAPQMLAGAAIIASNQPAPENLSITRGVPSAPVPVVTIHGTRDPLAPYNGGKVSFRGLFPKGEHLSAQRTAAYFAARNGITAAPSIERWPSGSTTDTRVYRTNYRQAGCSPVTFYAVEGGGHQIPNPIATPMPWLWGSSPSSLNAAEVIAEFFGLPYPDQTNESSKRAP